MGSLIEQMLADMKAVGGQKTAAGEELFWARRQVGELTRKVELECNKEFGVEEKRELYKELIAKEAKMAEEVNSKISFPVGALIDEYVAQNKLEENDVYCKCYARFSNMGMGQQLTSYNFKVRIKNCYSVFDFTRDENQVRFANGGDISSHIVNRPNGEYNGNEYLVRDPRNIIFKVNYKELDSIRQNSPKIYRVMVAVLDSQLAETSERK